MIQGKIYWFYVDYIGKLCDLPIIPGCLNVFVGTYGKQKSTLKTCINITECVNALDLAVIYFFSFFFFCGIQISLIKLHRQMF